MVTTPFMTLKLRGKKDAILVRQRARRLASLLGYDIHEQACIAAGSFVVACQALLLFGKAKICFQMENHHLQIFAQEAPTESAPLVAERLAAAFPEAEAKLPFRLTKPLPRRDVADDIEIGWLVKKVEETACDGLFDEIVKQNQEVLSLLHEVRLYQLDANKKEAKSPSPHAA
jgi:hypothetical protein